jgi:molybdopterin molybdotransferase/putative molybdopterin biosynthesis protein
MDKESPQQITNSLAAVRRQRGLPVAALAKTVGVSRQTIHAIEGGTYVPNTAIALRLAQALEVGVEDLFSLPESKSQKQARETVSLLPSFEEWHPGQAVQLCQVDGRLMAASASPGPWYLPPSDAILSAGQNLNRKAKVHLHDADKDFSNRLLLAGCDPAMTLLARCLQPAGIELVLLHQNSSQALALLKRGHVHIAGTHLRDETTGESNVSALRKFFPADSVTAVSFALWEEGLVVANGNPKHLEGVQDLARKDITFLNRESGAGSRFLLDGRLKRLRLDPKRVRGYDRTAPGHLAAAWEVKTGRADCCIATAATARAFGLDFVPLETSRYDLVVRKEHLKTPGVQALFDVINRLSFRQQLNSVSGYDTAATGGQVL